MAIDLESFIGFDKTGNFLYEAFPITSATLISSGALAIEDKLKKQRRTKESNIFFIGII
jgi:hypothetical protein